MKICKVEMKCILHHAIDKLPTATQKNENGSYLRGAKLPYG